MLRKIRLYGSLAKFVGSRVLEADISTAAEAVRFLVANFEGLEQHMADKHYRVITHTSLAADELHDITNVEAIKIVPVIEGSGAVGRILAGIALIAISFFVPFVAPILFGLGASLVLGGVAQLITPVPRVGQGENSTSDIKKSYNFSGIQQTSRAGTPVPLVYGKTLVGSVVISAGIGNEIEDLGGGAGPIEITYADDFSFLTVPSDICIVNEIIWFLNGADSGQRGEAFYPSALDGGKTVFAMIKCNDGTTITTPPTVVQVYTSNFRYWRARRLDYVSEWFPTASGYPYWYTPFNDPPTASSPKSQAWFGGSTIRVASGSMGGVLAALWGIRKSDNTIFAVFGQWVGGVSPEEPYSIGAPFGFEFSQDGETTVEVIELETLWDGYADGQGPKIP
jgi:predicted phage tail protein